MFKKVLIKLSGEALAGDGTNNFDDAIINKIVSDIIDVMKSGTEVALVIGGGNFWRGRSATSNMDRNKADQIGMLATVMNAIYVADVFKQQGVVAEVMTPFYVGNMTKLFNKDEADESLKSGKVTIFAGGVGHPYFSTDTITALRAIELSCDCILYAKNVDGIYNADPNKDSTAVKYKEITYRKIIEDDLQAIDLTAMILSETNNITSLVFGLNEPDSIAIACKNDDTIYTIGTKIIS